MRRWRHPSNSEWRGEQYWSEPETVLLHTTHHYCTLLPYLASSRKRLLHHTALASLFATFGLGHLQE